jgi:prepilin-type N-terminal cleavage/methylation domain-containing protein
MIEFKKDRAVSSVAGADSPAVRGGFTMIELMVTITILVVLALIIVPSVRMLSRERKVYDTASSVGAAISSARERARVDGIAGVEIVPLANNFDMGMAIYQMRAVPAYSGDSLSSLATIVDVLPLPPPTLPITSFTALVAGDLSATTGANIQVNDELELNNSTVRYRVTAVAPPVLPETRWTVVCARAPHDPEPPYNLGAPFGVPYRFHRQPVRVESTRLRLPRNLFINLAWSGYGSTGFQCRTGALNGSVRVLFNRDGSVDQILDRVNGGLVKVDGPLFFLFCSGEGDQVDVMNLANEQFFNDDDNVWIVVDHRSGGVTPGKISEAIGATTPLRLEASRRLAGKRQGITP